MTLISYQNEFNAIEKELKSEIIKEGFKLSAKWKNLCKKTKQNKTRIELKK